MQVVEEKTIYRLSGIPQSHRIYRLPRIDESSAKQRAAKANGKGIVANLSLCIVHVW